MSDTIRPLQRLKPVNVLNHKSHRSPIPPDRNDSALSRRSRFRHPIPPAPMPARPTSFRKAETGLCAPLLSHRCWQHGHALVDYFPITPSRLSVFENDEGELVARHPERSAVESKDPVALAFRFASGSLDFARDDRFLVRGDKIPIQMVSS